MNMNSKQRSRDEPKQKVNWRAKVIQMNKMSKTLAVLE